MVTRILIFALSTSVFLGSRRVVNSAEGGGDAGTN